MQFIIRLSESDYKKEVQAQKQAYSSLLKQMRRGRTVEVPLQIEGVALRFVGRETADGKELIILLTDLSLPKWKIFSLYSLRWQIECMFECLKSNGFHLEELGLREPSKVRLMLCLVIACYILCVCQGIKQLKKIAVRA